MSIRLAVPFGIPPQEASPEDSQLSLWLPLTLRPPLRNTGYDFLVLDALALGLIAGWKQACPSMHDIIDTCFAFGFLIFFLR